VIYSLTVIDTVSNIMYLCVLEVKRKRKLLRRMTEMKLKLFFKYEIIIVIIVKLERKQKSIVIATYT